MNKLSQLGTISKFSCKMSSSIENIAMPNGQILCNFVL